MMLNLRLAVDYVCTKPALVDENVAVEPGQVLPKHDHAPGLEQAHATMQVREGNHGSEIVHSHYALLIMRFRGRIFCTMVTD